MIKERISSPNHSALTYSSSIEEKYSAGDNDITVTKVIDKRLRGGVRILSTG